MSSTEDESDLLRVFDRTLFELQSASEMLAESWRQIFNKPYKNLFRKINFQLHHAISEDALLRIEKTREELDYGPTDVPILIELDKHLRVLKKFGERLNTCINKLLKKANGYPYRRREYNQDIKILDEYRGQVIDSQNQLNILNRDFLSRFQPEDIPDYPQFPT